MYIAVACTMYIATRRARLEAREAGFLVLYKTVLNIAQSCILKGFLVLLSAVYTVSISICHFE